MMNTRKQATLNMKNFRPVHLPVQSSCLDQVGSFLQLYLIGALIPMLKTAWNQQNEV
jgi:hypothetical protein